VFEPEKFGVDEKFGALELPPELAENVLNVPLF
jgi:hypothetical protein